MFLADWFVHNLTVHNQWKCNLFAFLVCYVLGSLVEDTSFEKWDLSAYYTVTASNLMLWNNFLLGPNLFNLLPSSNKSKWFSPFWTLVITRCHCVWILNSSGAAIGIVEIHDNVRPGWDFVMICLFFFEKHSVICLALKFTLWFI